MVGRGGKGTSSAISTMLFQERGGRPEKDFVKRDGTEACTELKVAFKDAYVSIVLAFNVVWWLYGGVQSVVTTYESTLRDRANRLETWRRHIILFVGMIRERPGVSEPHNGLELRDLTGT